MAKRGGSDHDGNALSGFERIVKNDKEVKDTRTEAQRFSDNKELRDQAERKRKEAKRIEEEADQFTGVMDRDLYVKNKDIIAQKEKGIKEPKEPKAPKEKAIKEPKAPKAPKVAAEPIDPADVVLVKVLYGLNEIVIDVTEKVVLGGLVNNKIAGSDPVKNKKKKVYVTATIKGVTVEKTFPEGKELVF